MQLLSRVAVVVVMLVVPLVLALASQSLAARPGAPAVPDVPVVLDGATATAPRTVTSPSAAPPATPGGGAPVVVDPAPLRVPGGSDGSDGSDDHDDD